MEDASKYHVYPWKPSKQTMTIVKIVLSYIEQHVSIHVHLGELYLNKMVQNVKQHRSVSIFSAIGMEV